MSVHSINGKRPQIDIRQDRIAAGTLGGEHAIPNSFGSSSISRVVDDADTEVIYGTFDGTAFTAYENELDEGLQINYGYSDSFGGTTHVLLNNNDSIKFRFQGSSISVLAAIHNFGANASIYIDGVLTEGRIGKFTSLQGVSIPAIDDSVTTIPCAGTTGFASSGKICIGSEVISYSGTTAFSFTGCTRGIDGTTASEHEASEAIYAWSSTGSNYYPMLRHAANRRVIWSNHLLSPGIHEIIVRTNATGGTSFDFDGFIVGNIVNASSIRTFMDTIAIETTTDGNGHADIGVFVTNNPEIVIIGVLGYTQITPDTSVTNTTTLAKLAVKGTTTSGKPHYYLHNGPTSSSIVINLYVTYLGGSAI